MDVGPTRPVTAGDLGPEVPGDDGEGGHAGPGDAVQVKPPPVSGTLTFKVGQSLAYIPLVIAPDVIAEGPETFTLSLANPRPQGSVSLGPVASQTLTIADNDFGGTVQFGAATLTASPGESKAIPIVRTGGGGTILTVNWQAISGTTSEAFSPTSGQRDLRRQRDDQELHDRHRWL